MLMQPPGSASTAPPPPANNRSSGTPQSTPDTSPAKAWADAVAQATANGPQQTVTVKPGDSLASIAESHGDTLSSVEQANPQVQPPWLLPYPGTVLLPKKTPAQVVSGVDNSQIKPIITAMANANLADQNLQETAQNAAKLHVRDPSIFSDAQAQSTASWNAVEQATYNMLTNNNVRAFPDVTAAGQVQQLNALEPGNAKFAAANDAALAEAKQKWTQMGVTKDQLGPIIDAYNNAKQINQDLQNPHLLHSSFIVGQLNADEQQANAQLNAAIEKSLTQAANQAGGNSTARAAAVAQRAHNIESFGPHEPAFQTAVRNAQTDVNPVIVGWQQPTNWTAVNSPGSPHPSGVDPFNIIISGNSNVTLQQFLQGLEAVPNPAGGSTITLPGGRGVPPRTYPAQWEPVGTATNFWGKALEGFTGAEYANVQPQGAGGSEIIQQLSMRVGGTQTVDDSNINHFRLYKQDPIPGVHQSAYFIAASTESFHLDFPAFWDSTHDVTKNGFDRGATELLNDIRTAAHMQGWNFQMSVYHGKPGTGSNGISYDGETYVVTLTHKSGQATGSQA
jgi:LysM repeat protein